jgi:hypothetical protein
MTKKLVKVTFILEVPEDIYPDFLLACVEDTLEPGEKTVGFQVADTNLEKLEVEGLTHILFTDD